LGAPPGPRHVPGSSRGGGCRQGVVGDRSSRKACACRPGRPWARSRPGLARAPSWLSRSPFASRSAATAIRISPRSRSGSPSSARAARRVLAHRGAAGLHQHARSGRGGSAARRGARQRLGGLEAASGRLSPVARQLRAAPHVRDPSPAAGSASALRVLRRAGTRALLPPAGPARPARCAAFRQRCPWRARRSSRTLASSPLGNSAGHPAALRSPRPSHVE